ncbi:MAG: rhodanese-like domain-containing protein [Planctomycetota bacterium]
MNWTGIIVLAVLAVAVAACASYRSRGSGRDVSQAQLLEWMDQKSNLCILDVRTADEYDSGHIPGAINIGHKEITLRLDELKPHKDENIVVYCERGVRARTAQSTLTKAGFPSVYHLAGDMAAWRNAGRPAETATTRPDE